MKKNKNSLFETRVNIYYYKIIINELVIIYINYMFNKYIIYTYVCLI